MAISPADEISYDDIISASFSNIKNKPIPNAGKLVTLCEDPGFLTHSVS